MAVLCDQRHTAIAEKVGEVETAADFFKKQTGNAIGEGLVKYLRAAPKSAPEPEDKLRVGALGQLATLRLRRGKAWSRVTTTHDRRCKRPTTIH